MRIAGARLVPWTRPLPRPAASARARWDERCGLFLELRAADGTLGVGDAAPLAGYSSETISDARASLEALAASLPVDIDAVEPLASPASSWLDELKLVPSARFAAETALCDLASRRADRSLEEILGAVRPEPVALQALLPVGEPEAAALAARRAVDDGFAAVKLKIGAEDRFDEEMHAAMLVREEIGRDGLLRLDANRAFAPHVAPSRLLALAAARPDFVEEPVAGGALETLLGVPTRIAADESLQHPRRAEMILDRALCQVLVLKPAALGGLARCLELARRGEELGFGLVVSHLFDSPVGHAAAAALALSIEPAPSASGLASHAVLESFGYRPPIEDGRLLPSPHPGVPRPEDLR